MPPVDPHSSAQFFHGVANAIDAHPNLAQAMHDALAGAGMQYQDPSGMSAEQAASYYADLTNQAPAALQNEQVQAALQGLRGAVHASLPAAAADEPKVHPFMSETDAEAIRFVILCIVFCA